MRYTLDIAMKILLINTNRYTSPFPVIPLGACMIAEAAEKAGHSVRFLDFMFQSSPLTALQQALKADRFDVVGLSLRNIDNNDMYNPIFFLEDVPSLVKSVRNHSDADIVIGGAAVGVMPEEILRFSGADYAAPGDGELLLPEILSGIEKGERTCPGAGSITDDVYRYHDRRPAGSTLCTVPDFRRWIDLRSYQSRFATVPLQTKIGCRFKCVYCTYRKIEGEDYRLCPPQHVAEQVMRLSSEGLNEIEFVDNVFNAPYEHALEICSLLKNGRRSTRLISLELNPHLIDDALLNAMEQAGFAGMGITAESASENVLHKLRKPFDAGDVLKAASTVRKHNIPCVWIFLLGGPGETVESVEQTLSFAERQIRPADAVFFNVGVRIYPGTELETIAREQGILNVSPAEMLRPVFYLSPNLDPGWLSARMRSFMQTHMNVINSASLGVPFLPYIQRIAYRLGVKAPLWRHTSVIRRILKYSGIYS
ncbi:MAG TPA: radical SAM protein [Dissulfurispiraceae bacterium]|nr:radical SAM protein [Dissulfurispiraceae bacterium]